MTGLQLKAEIEKLSLTHRKVAEIIGITPQTLYNWYKQDEFDANTIEKIKTTLHIDVTSNPSATNTTTTDCCEVLLVPTSAMAGSLSGFSSSVMAYECERVVSPIRGVDLALRVDGDSMSPEYPNGSMVLVKRVQQVQYIEWGRVYAIDTVDGTVIKQLRKSPNDSEVICHSLNIDQDQYAPFSILKEDIIAIYRVRLMLTTK